MTDEKDVLNEPALINTIYVTDVELDMEDTNIIVTSTQAHRGERRVVWRSVVPIRTAQKVYQRLAFLLGKPDADR
jgi:hypothetical protein